MPDSDIVTRCPQCNTAFRVTPNQLAVADGVVRCGSCLAVFRAIDYKAINEDDDNKQKQKQKQKQKGKKSTAEDEDNIEYDDLDDDLVIIENDTYDLDSAKDQKKTSLFDRELRPAVQQGGESADESWAIDMLAEMESGDSLKPLDLSPDAEAKAEVKTEKAKPQPSAKKRALPSSPTTRKSSIHRGKAKAKADNQAVLENPPKKKADDIEELYFDHDKGGDEVNKAEAENSNTLNPNTLKPNTEQENSGSATISNEAIEKAMLTKTEYANDYLASIEPAPVEIEWFEAVSAHRWFWLGGTLLAALILIIQLAIYRFDSLGKDPSYRPFYQIACSAFGCELPSLINRERIRTTNLVVRSHPSQVKALVVDAILINTAKFQQPYPALRLEFSDLNNSVIAARNLQPKDYLRGELAGARQMPVNQPIQLSLAIVDPGDTAVNYQLSVVKAIDNRGK